MADNTGHTTERNDTREVRCRHTYLDAILYGTLVRPVWGRRRASPSGRSP
jgi:hypothetical protein